MNKLGIKESELYPAHVLIVDDDKSFGEMLLNVINKCTGFDCSFCDSARGALQALEKRVFDVVITDIKMPDMSGLELTRIIKEKYDSGVIVLTGYYEEFTYEQTIENGANDFIEKPVQPSELIIRLKRILWERAILYKRQQAEEELVGKSKALEELNMALKILIDHYKNDQEELQKRIVSNIKVRIVPYIERLKRTRLDIGQSALIEIIERNFHDISSPFLRLISSEHFRFTPKEVEIVSLIRDGKTTKEIAQILGIGKRTADSYRDNIRGKLGLANKKVNLRTYLLSIDNT